ncbi:alpha/beta hydrolase [Oxalobacteraceae bacterium CAVE-383]|nr:alpha/beta hydrolase [Oxalobacteraceae bacterium CAVE-383]
MIHINKFLICCLLFLTNLAMAERVVEQSNIAINGKQRRYFHLYDSQRIDNSTTTILLLGGSGCDDFGSYFPGFFKQYPTSVDVYVLDKPNVIRGADGTECTKEFNANDQLEKRVSDNIEFLNSERTLKKKAEHTIAVLGLSEGGNVALLIADASKKIGWLAAIGSGGLKQSDEFLIFADRGVRPYGSPYSRQFFLKKYKAIKRYKHNSEKEFFGHSYRYWASHLFFDPLPVYARLDIPIVVAMGEKDQSIPIESGRALKKYFYRHPQKNFRFIEYKNADHGLSTPERKGIMEFIGNLSLWFRDGRAYLGGEK